MNLEPGLVIAGKYRLDRPLATGGMGALWVARHLQLDVPLAIKFIDPSHANSTVARQRFEREARAAASLHGTHVVNVHDYGIASDVPYIAMELLQGEDLGRRLKRDRSISLPQAARILSQISRGLRRAHDAGLVHRDLKPANIFLARTEGGDEDEEVVKILDFGIAKEIAPTTVSESTKTGELMGSPHYMSPEQIRGLKDIDHRSDLWSLGVILFRAVTGHMPFGGEILGDVIARILADPIPRATKIAPDLPPALDPFFERAFARDRDQRFQSAREMAQTFSELVLGASTPVTGFEDSYTGSPPGPPSSSSAGPWSGIPASSPVEPNEPNERNERNERNEPLARSSRVLIASSVTTPSSLSSASPPDTMSPRALAQLQNAAPSSTPAPISTGNTLAATGGSILLAPTTRRRAWAWVGAATGLLLLGGGVAFSLARTRPHLTAGPQRERASAEEPRENAAPLPVPAPSAPSVESAEPLAASAPSASTSAPARPPPAPSSSAASAAALPNKAPTPGAPASRPSAQPPLKKKPAWGF